MDLDAERVEQERALVMELDGAGRAAFARGEYSQARRCFQQAAEACRESGWREELVYQLLQITQAMAHEPLFDPADARKLLDEALEIARSTGEARWILPAQINHIRLDLQEGHYADGLRAAQAALPMALDAGFEDFAGPLIQLAAFACVGLERFEAALRLHNAAQAQRDRDGTPTSERAVREVMERNLAPARKAFPAGKRSAIEAMGYQMSLAEVREYVAGLEIPS
jgi:tetratricopeptide (TPR) repeat protein